MHRTIPTSSKFGVRMTPRDYNDLPLGRPILSTHSSAHADPYRAQVTARDNNDRTDVPTNPATHSVYAAAVEPPRALHRHLTLQEADPHPRAGPSSASRALGLG